MAKVRPWAMMRRLQYIFGAFAFIGILGVLLYFSNYYVPPNCLDRILNGDETGVDCGGDCVQICVADILPPKVVWSESFEINEGQYNLVSYVENPNQVAGTPELQYKFELFNNGELVGERSGQTALPPNSIYPIFEGRVTIDDNQPVTETRLTINQTDLWLPSSLERGQFRATDINLSGADSRPRLEVDIRNSFLSEAEDVEVVATIFNDLGKPITASQTYIENIEADSTERIIFTWPNPIAKTVRSCVIPTDVALAIDLSGSMNNDGGDPPEPVTKALEAASQFVSSLNNNDQVAVVRFASDAGLVTGLTREHSTVADTINNLQIKPTEETGFTNTAAALRLVQTELNSTNHNQDARRVLVLLTDGLPTAEGNDDIISETKEQAEQLDLSGIEVYSIGLGSNVDREFVVDLASVENNAYFAPSGEDLSEIYAEITSSICESGPTKIEVIAKTKTNFAEIR